MHSWPRRIGVGVGLIVTLLAIARGSAAEKERVAVPDEAARKQAAALVREVYQADFTAAKTGPKKGELAQKLLAQAAADKKDVAGYYALLTEAKELAAASGEAALALQAAGALGEHFDVPAAQIKVDTITALNKTATTAAQAKPVAEGASAAIDEATAADDFENARKLHMLAEVAVRRARDSDLLKQITAQGKGIDALARGFEEVKAARQKLKDDPTDAAASTLLGKYQCFQKGDWERGLPSLAIGSDKPLADLASLDLSEPAEPDEQMKVGDGWWDLSNTEKNEPVRNHLQARALKWYETAFPKLTGLTKEKIDRRLADAARVPKGAVLLLGMDKDDVSKKGNRFFLRDASGRGHVGELIALAPAPGKVGGGLAFDGDKSNLVFPHAKSLDLDVFSYSMWVNFKKMKGGQVLFNKKKSHQMWLDTFEPLRFDVHGRGTDRNRGTWHDNPGDPAIRLQAGKWYHIVAAFDGEKCRIYLDGELKAASRAIDDKVKLTTEPLSFGQKDWTFSSTLDGVLDEVAVFDHGLSAAEVMALYRMGQRGKSVAK